jgi:hypothetical protein
LGLGRVESSDDVDRTFPDVFDGGSGVVERGVDERVQRGEALADLVDKLVGCAFQIGDLGSVHR